MASVDLYGTDAQKIRSQYQTALGRSASDDEVSGWLSGSYGGGGVDSWLNQIASSHEAQQRRTAQPVSNTMPVTGFGSPESGYGPGGVNNPAYGGSANRPGYKDLNYWQQQGVGYGDIFNLQTGQPNTGWARTANGYERTGGGSNVPGPQNGDFQSWFMGLTGGRAPNPQSLKALEPMLNQYGIKLGPANARGFTDGIILPNGQFVDVITAATETGGTGWAWQTGGGHAGGGGGMQGMQYSDPHTRNLEQMMLARIQQLQGGQDQGYQQLLSYLQQRFQDLQGPGRTGAEQEIVRTQTLDPIERDRSAARQRMLERLSQRGITPDSGIAQQALLEIDKAFDAERATAQTRIGVDELNRREGRNQRAEGLAASIYELPQAREREALGYAGGLADLGPQRLQLAMQAAGMSGNPQSMFQSLMQLAQLNQNSALLDQRNSGALWSGLGEIAYSLMNSGR